ncbi:plasmid recombination protein, partial [Neorhizobium sp. SHOUNA12B]|uniref:plasmid recombination protein n=2 Tax=unclassified Neorhizobium TaxID=2629175 RepID=UPI0025E57DF6
MAFQFTRIELFSRKGKGGRSVGFVLDEVVRVPVASMHVHAPGPPVVVFGLDPEAVRVLHDERASSARQEVKGGKLRAIRADQNTLATVILSHPATMEEYRSSPELAAEVQAWERRSVAWLRAQYGDQLVSAIRHEDESHPHLHAYVIPDDPAMKAGPLHPGFQAKAAVTAAGPRPGEDDKALSKRANAAYQAAMRRWLDDYHQKVGQPSGLLRLGPGKRHLTRAEWQAEKRQAAALKEALAKAETLKNQGAAFIDRTKGEAAKLRADAARRADAAQAAIV